MAEYWAGLAGGAVPHRGLLDVTAIPHLLANLLLVEQVEEGYLIRVAGQAFQWKERQLTGRLVGPDHFGPAHAELTAMYATILAGRGPVWFRGLANWKSTPAPMPFTQVMAPMLAPDGTPRFLLGAVVLDMHRFRSP
ncbi:MAG: hypothetical protein RLY86_1807 [Pseudomonadota bacterium]|jgi:hypothetical protein